jgi:hypothetical protein
MTMTRSIRNYFPAVIAIFCLVATDQQADADALVITRAMLASTIVEVFFEGGQVALRLRSAQRMLNPLPMSFPTNSTKRLPATW